MNKEILRNALIIFGVYSIILLFIGRQLSFIPEIKFENKASVETEGDIRLGVLEKFLKEENGSYSIYYKNLVTGEEFGVDENKIQTAASLNKVPIVALLYNQAEHKKVDLEDEITVQEIDIQDYGTGSIRYEEPGKSYSLKTLTKLSLEQSDNTAAHVLGLHLGRDKIQTYMESLGLVATDMEENMTSARDMGLILEKIYNRQIAKDGLTAELLDFMKDTDFEDRLARDLPEGVEVYHKAADGVGFVHDVGIIDDGKTPFILSVLTSEIDDVEEAKATIGKIAAFIQQAQN